MVENKNEILSAKTKARSVFICLFLGVLFGVVSIFFPNVNLVAIFGFLLGWLGVILGVSVYDINRGGKEK